MVDHLPIREPPDDSGRCAEQSRDREFVVFYMANMARIYGYIFTLVPSWADADDIFQETTAVMWRKYEHFETAAGFVNWAAKIARHKIMQRAEKRAKETNARCNLTVQKSLEQAAEVNLQNPSRVQAALQRCLGQLRTRDRELLYLRYEESASTRSVAARVGRSVEAVYKALNRIHYQLLCCIQKRLSAEESV